MNEQESNVATQHMPTAVHYSNGAGAWREDAREKGGLGRTWDMDQLGSVLYPRVRADLAAGRDVHLNWMFGHFDGGKHSAYARTRLYERDDGYAEELDRVLTELVTHAASRGEAPRLWLWVGVRDLDEESVENIGQWAERGFDIVADNSSTLSNWDPRVPLLKSRVGFGGGNYATRVSRGLMIEGLWKPGVVFDWQHEYDAIVRYRSLENWQKNAGEIPGGLVMGEQRTAHIIEMSDDERFSDSARAALESGNIENIKTVRHWTYREEATQQG